MPKRTNDFQSLIKFIYDRITPEGGKVTESAMVYDKDSKTLREVDILIEHKISGHTIKIAVECRDRSRKDSIEWIDGLVGKTSSLDVNKVVAVSKKGFAQAAIDKAKSHGIDTLSIEEASEKDWQSYFIKPGLAVWSDELYTLKNVLYVTNGEYREISELGMDSEVELKGEVVGTVKEVFEWIFLEIIIPQAQAYVKEHLMEIFKTYADLKKTMYLEKEQDLSEMYVITSKGCKNEISKVKFIVHGARQITDVKQNHSVFNEKMISTSEHIDTDSSILKFKILQDPDTKQLHANWIRESGE
jgi:hypothetical protein